MTTEIKGCWVYTTVPDLSSAKSLARAIVERRLAACANIIPGLQSIYWWEDKIEESEELAVIFKTVPHLFESMSEAIAKAHPYDCPCILQLNWDDVQKAYGTWLQQNLIND